MKNNNKVFGILAILVGAVAVGFVYAGFTGTLNINGTGNVVSSKWDVYFANLSNAVTTGTANVVTPATINPKTKIGDYYVELASPGDSVTYTFDVVNDGNFDAILTTLTKSTPTCTPSATLCSYLTYTLKYTSDNTNVAADDELLAGETKNMTLVLTLRSDTPASALSSTELSVTGLGITLLYSQNSGYKNGSGSSSGGGSNEVATDTSCFEYEIDGGDAIITGYDEECTKNVVIPSEIEGFPVKVIRGYNHSTGAFSSNQLTSITIPNSVTTIGEGAFAENQLTSVTIPNSVTTIGEGAFSGNQLTSVTIPNSVISIGGYAFLMSDCWTDYSCTLSIDMTNVPYSAFSNMGITSLTLGPHVQTLGDNAFESNQLTSVTIPNSVTSIGNNAFAYNQLTSVIIKTKTSSSAFSYYGGSGIWGWADEYDDSNIIWGAS